MTYRLVIRERAEKQIEEAYEWYEKKQIGLGDNYLDVIERSLMLIQINPKLFQFKYKNIKAIYTKQFPFGIFYIIDGDKIVVLAVFHLSRNPSLWKKII